MQCKCSSYTRKANAVMKSFLVCRLNCRITMIWPFIVFVVITMQHIWKCRILLAEKGLWNSMICVSFFYDREAMRTKAKSAINGLKKSLLDMKTFINEVSNILIVWINWDLLNTNKFRHFIKCSSSIRTCKSKICSINNLDIVIKMYIFDILVYSIILASVVFLWDLWNALIAYVRVNLKSVVLIIMTL